MPLTGAVADHFRVQAAACRRLGSPFTGHLCERLVALLDRGSEVGRRVAGWPGSPGGDALALRLCGGLHALVRSGRDAGLAAVYPPAPVPAPGFDAALLDAIAAHDAWLAAFLDSAPQTNEVGRSGVLLGGLLTVAARTGLPLEILEIGCSAGLNLLFDRHRYRLGERRGWGSPAAPLTLSCEWRGEIPPLDAPLVVAARRGSDIAPIDPGDPAARARLLGYIWPDQPERLARIGAALALAAREGPQVERAEAADWVEAILDRPGPPGRARVLMHSIVWRYLPRPTQARIGAAIARAGEEADAHEPLAWLRLEPDGPSESPAILLDIWPRALDGGRKRLLGRGDWHGRWAEWGGAG
jgi:hypothetical protein